jgi:glutamate carboxypeptidase
LIIKVVTKVNFGNSKNQTSGNHLYSRIALSLLACSIVIAASAQESSTTSVEDVITGRIDEETARATSLLQQSVDINSGTMNFAGVRAVGTLLEPEFSELGFTTEWADGAAFDRAGHLLAERDGRGPKILLIGHLDTVFPIDSPLQKFELVDKHFAEGPGTTDMKGGNVIMIHALRALDAAGVLDDISVRVVLTGDEELSGNPKRLRSAALIDAGIWADYAIGFEDGDGNMETAVIARRGSSGWTLSVSGTRAHSSQVFQPEFGAGAIYEAARILQTFRTRLSSMENLTFNPGLILGGTDIEYDAVGNRGSAFGKDNVISSSVTVTGDLRAVSPQQWQEARQAMIGIVAEHLPMTSASIEFDQGYPPMAPSSGNYELLELYSRVSEDLGYGEVAAVNPRNAGAADISFVANDVAMAMDGVGLMGSGGHTLDEVADLRTLGPQTKRVAILLYRLSQLESTGSQ